MIKRLHPGTRMSQAVVCCQTVYIAGQIADDLSEPLAGQTRAVMAKIDRLLAESGSDRSHLLSITVLLPDIAGFDEMNGVYDAWIDPSNPPARACFEARLADPDIRIEVVAVAALRHGET